MILTAGRKASSMMAVRAVVGAGRWSAARWLSLVALVLALAAAAPILGVLLQALDLSQGPGALRHLASTVLPRFALTSIQLSFLVLVLVLLIGVGCGWLVAAYEFPGRAALAFALVLPLAVPGYVMAYAYTDFLETYGPVQGLLREITGLSVREYWFPDIRSVPGAAAMLGLSLYPYVFMLAYAAFSERSAALGEAARTLGASGFGLWWRVVWPVARPAVVAGAALVLMETLADFGTVSYFAVDTFSAGIYRAWQGLGDKTAAARLAVVLLLFVAALVWLERRGRRRSAYHTRSVRPAPRRPIRGAAGWLASAACALPVLLGFVAPVVLLARAWLGADAGWDMRVWQWAGNTAVLGGLAAALTVLLALIVAYSIRLSGSRLVTVAATVAAGGYAVPGIVLAVGLLALASVLDAIGAGWLRAGATLLVYAYCVRFFSVSFQPLEAGLKRVSPSMDASARTLGARPLEVLARVHWPLLRPTLAGTSVLVFVDCLKELPATLVLRPFNMDTLAVVAYQFASDERLAEAALPSLMIVAVALVPTLWLARAMARRA